MRQLLLALFLSPALAFAGEGGGWPALTETDVDSVYSQGIRSQTSDRGLVQTDVEGVYKSGQQPSFPTQALVLEPGLYEIGGATQGSKSTHYMIVDRYVNDDEKFIVVVFPVDLRTRGSAIGHIFQGRPILGGTSMMLTNLVLLEDGDLGVESMLREDAPHIQMISNPGHGREIYLKGNHRLLQSQVVRGLKVSTKSRPQLGLPVAGVYGGERSSPNLLAIGSQLSLRGSEYEMIPMNGSGGALIGLARTSLNTMGEYLASRDQLEMLLLFVRECWANDAVIEVRQTGHLWGQYQMTYHEENFTGTTLEQIGDVLADIFRIGER